MNAMHTPIKINIKQVSKRTGYVIDLCLKIFIKYIRIGNISITTLSITKDKLKLRSVTLGSWLPCSL